MSKIAVVPSPRFPVSKWTPAIANALREAKVHGLEQIALLGDTIPAAGSWVNNPNRQNSGLLIQEVRTDWQSRSAVQERNDALLTDAEVVVVLGEVLTSSARHALGRAFAESKTVVQVVGEAATAVTPETIVTGPGYGIEVPKPLAAKSASGFEEFMSAAPKKGARK